MEATQSLWINCKAEHEFKVILLVDKPFGQRYRNLKVLISRKLLQPIELRGVDADDKITTEFLRSQLVFVAVESLESSYFRNLLLVPWADHRVASHRKRPRQATISRRRWFS